jgi:hypothetical protein
VLQHATALDFEVLGLDRINPPLFRDEDQGCEDELCKRLLMLGARWFESGERYLFIEYVAEDEEMGSDIASKFKANMARNLSATENVR